MEKTTGAIPLAPNPVANANPNTSPELETIRNLAGLFKKLIELTACSALFKSHVGVLLFRKFPKV
jgi:hypothetical protein